MPRVSIITPFYNADDESRMRSIESIERQTNKDFEWIQVNDGSTDKYAYFGDVILDRNYGPSVARNVGFQISSGDIITYLDMGDELSPDRVQQLIHLHDDYPVDISFCGYRMVQGDFVGMFNPFDFVGRTMSAIDYIQLLRKQNISIPMGVSHVRRPFVECGGFQRGIVCGEDGILWRRMLEKVSSEKIIISDFIAGTYYVTDDGQSRTQRRFEMGGFAFDGSRNDNGEYLDEQWFREYSSNGLYD